MPYSGKAISSVPTLPHYVNPNSVINVTLTDYDDDLQVGDTIGTITYTDKDDRYPDELKTATMVCSTVGSSSYFDCTIDITDSIILRVEIGHVSDNCKIVVDNWRDYDSTVDFDRFVIYEIDLDW